MKNKTLKIFALLSATGVLLSSTACSKKKQDSTITCLQPNDTISGIILDLSDQCVGVDDILTYKEGRVLYTDSDEIEYQSINDWDQMYGIAMQNEDYYTAGIYLEKMGYLIVKDSLEDVLGITFRTFNPMDGYAYVTYKDNNIGKIKQANIFFKDEIGKKVIGVLSTLSYGAELDAETLRYCEDILMQYLCTSCSIENKSNFLDETYYASNLVSDSKTRILSSRK